MTLPSSPLGQLLRQYAEITKKTERARDSLAAYERQRETAQLAISDQVSRDFRIFVDIANADLPTDRRVTDWHVHYNGGLRKAFITITRIGGRPYETDEFGQRTRLPPHLAGLRKFGGNYPVDVSFDALNHAYLDTPLEEMK